MMLLSMNVMTRSSNIITMRKIILSFSYMLPTMFLERPKIIQRCSIPPMRFTNTSCAVSAVRLSKAGLCYNEAENRIRDRIRDWIVELPERGFLFPAFHDRSTDLHAML